MSEITKDMAMGEIISKYPKVAGVFMKYGLHCIGCHVAHMETLEQGCLAHGMDEKSIKKMIDEANKAVKES